MQRKIKIANIIQAIQNYVIENQDNPQRTMPTKKIDASTTDHIDGVLKMQTIKWKKAYQFLEPAFQSSGYDNEAKLLNSIINRLLIDPIDDVEVLKYTELLLESCSGYRVANPQLVEHANSLCSITKSIVSEKKSLTDFALLLKGDATIHYTIDDSSLLLKVIKVEFANVDYDGNCINTYSSSLYSNAYYLKPRISISYAAGANHEIEIFVKIISPSGILSQGNTSPQGYSFKTRIKLGKSSYELMSWGNNKQTCYSEVGLWKIELWFDNKLLHREPLNISLDPEIIRKREEEERERLRKKAEEEERRRKAEEDRQRRLQMQRAAEAAAKAKRERERKIRIGVLSAIACVAIFFIVKYGSSYINYHITEYNSLVEQAESSISSGDYNTAIHFYELAKERKSNKEKIKELDGKIQNIKNNKEKKISESLTKIDAIIKSNATSIKYGVINYDDPKKMIDEVLLLDPSNANAKGYLLALDAQKKRIK